MAPQHDWPDDVRTLAIDIGGSGFKAAVLSPDGKMLTQRVRIETPYPCPPDTFVDTVTHLVHDLGHWDRVSVGFPGLVRDGKVRALAVTGAKRSPVFPDIPTIDEAGLPG